MKFGFTILRRARDTYANRREPESLRTFAEVYWRVLLISACVLAIGAIGYGVWQLSDVLASLSAAPSASRVPAPVLNRVFLDATLNSYDARRILYDSLKDHPPISPMDPSK